MTTRSTKRIPFRPEEKPVILKSSELAKVRSAAGVKKVSGNKEIDLQKKREIAAIKRAKAEQLRQTIEQRRADFVQPPSDLDIENARSNQRLREKAEKAHEDDDMKRLNSQIVTAMALAAQDKQIQERETQIKTLKEEEKLLHQQMEKERIESEKIENELAIAKKKDIQRGADALRKQIMEREAEAKRNRELMEQEKEEVIRNIERLRDEDNEKLKAKQQYQRKLQEEIRLANEEQIRSKQRLIQAEKEAEYEAVQYLKDKAASEQRALNEKEAIRRNKEREWGRMRSMQKKIHDDRSERDELLARRVLEQKEREWRANEMRELQRQAKMKVEMRDSMVESVKQKEIDRKARIQADMDEKQRLAEMRKQQEEITRLENLKLRNQTQESADLLQEQIRLKEEVRKQTREVVIDEGKIMREKVRHEKEHFENIKQKKLAQLRSQGVPEKYLVDIENLQKVGV